jgi:hypothetical protein
MMSLCYRITIMTAHVSALLFVRLLWRLVVVILPAEGLKGDFACFGLLVSWISLDIPVKLA